MTQKLMVILEGFDNTGKSTLARRLENVMGVSGHMSNGRPQTVDEMFDRMRKYILEPGISLHDRIHCISERVYGPVLRGVDSFGIIKEGREIVQAFKETPHLIIYCRPPSEHILEFGTRDQMDGVVDKARKLLRAYDNMFRHMINEGDWNISIYDYTAPESFDEIKERIGGLV